MEQNNKPQNEQITDPKIQEMQKTQKTLDKIGSVACIGIVGSIVFLVVHGGSKHPEIPFGLILLGTCIGYGCLSQAMKIDREIKEKMKGKSK